MSRIQRFSGVNRFLEVDAVWALLKKEAVPCWAALFSKFAHQQRNLHKPQDVDCLNTMAARMIRQEIGKRKACYSCYVPVTVKAVTTRWIHFLLKTPQCNQEEC